MMQENLASITEETGDPAITTAAAPSPHRQVSVVLRHPGLRRGAWRAGVNRRLGSMATCTR